MKPSEIIKHATDSLADGIRANYVFGNLFLHDAIETHVTDLKSEMQKQGILRLENKKLVGNLEKRITSAFANTRRQMGEQAYAYTPTILDKFEEEFGQKLKVLYYSAKREYDRSGQTRSGILAHLTMIYLLSRFELSRTTWYANEIQKTAGVGMQAVYDQNILAVRNISGRLLQQMQDKYVNMKAGEIRMAFEIFEKELNECKVEFYKKTA